MYCDNLNNNYEFNIYNRKHLMVNPLLLNHIYYGILNAQSRFLAMPKLAMTKLMKYPIPIIIKNQK